MPFLTLRRTLDAVQVEPLAGPLLARYSTVKELSTLTPSGPGELTLTAYAGSGEPAVLPPTRHPEFIRCAAKVSTNIQATLRAWLPFLWFADPAGFDDFDLAAAVLIYASCRTFTARDKTAYTFDVLDSDTPRAVLYSATRSLTPRLSAIYRMLAAMGHPRANQYKPMHVDRVLGSYRRKPHPLHSILVAERDLIEAYVTQGDWSTDEERRLEADTAITRRLRKLVFQRDCCELRPLLDHEARLVPVLLEATWDARNVPVPALP